MKVVVTCACHSFPLAKALQFLVPEWEFVPIVPRLEPDDLALRAAFSNVDVWLNEEPLKEHNQRVYDLVGHKEFQELRIPLITFYGFHPDDEFQAVRSDRQLARGPLDNVHHSTLVLSSYLVGRPIDRVRELFVEQVFDRMGYFDLWEFSFQSLRSVFERHLLPFDRFALRLLRLGHFMHDPLHPTSQVIAYFAQEIVESVLKINCVDATEILGCLDDSLRPARVFPVYPAIAIRLGIPGGSYRWWFSQGYIQSLDDFIRFSYDAYEKQDLKDLESKRCSTKVVRELVTNW